MELIVQIAGVALALAAALFGFEYLRGRSRTAEVEKFNRQRAEALALDEEIKKLKKDVIRDTANFEEALKKHRAKYGRKE